jgi:Domain of unknown function (DUF4157)
MSFARVIQGYFPGGRPRVTAAPATAQRKAAQPQMHGNAMPLPDNLQHVGRGGLGRALPEALQQKMESFFGASFADVRVHVGPEAPAIGALAFTLGSNIYFAPGQYDPVSPRGQQLLGHELAHVVQQRQGRVRNPYGAGIAVVQDPGLEAEADRMGQRAAVQTMMGPGR